MILLTWLGAWSPAPTSSRASELCRVDWPPPGRSWNASWPTSSTHPVDDEEFEAGVDGVLAACQHHLMLVTHHRSAKLVWAEEGRNAATLARFHDQGEPRRRAD
jgi:hypothetical protein